MNWKKEQTTVLEDKYASLKALVSNFPDDINNKEQLADCCSELLKFDEAEKLYLNLISEYPDKCKYFYRLGKVYSNEKKYDLALENQNKAIDLWKDFLWARFEKAKCLVELNKKNEAKNDLIEIISSKQFNEKDKIVFINIYKLISKLYLEENNNNEARKYVEKLIEIQPNEGMHYYCIGKIDLDEKKYESALSNFIKAKKYRFDSWIDDKIAVCYVYLNKNEEALKIYNEIPFNKKTDYIHQHHGRLFLKLGNLESAKKELKNALSKPGQSKFNAHFYLAKVFEELKLYKNAIREYNEAIKTRKSEFDKDFPEAQERIKYIESNYKIDEREELEAYQDIQFGIVMKFFKEKGFGFIKSKDGKEYFFHIKGCRYKDPLVNDAVKFEVVEGRKGLDAINVKKIT